MYSYIMRRLAFGAVTVVGVSIVVFVVMRVLPGDPLIAHLGADQVAAPIRLVDPQVGTLLHPGAKVDVLAASQSPTGPGDDAQSPARVIAAGVRVLAVPAGSASGSSAASSTGGSLVVLGVSRSEAQALAGAEAGGRLSVVLVAP